ncbi:SPRY domain-containing protein [Annulohypoxylon truncatum]|uniref:SPRY domain-containing protein n=1 Tax=Annulohypoxylon truncatum TaxID=327061 RepID=UPI0020075E27|nr:SPRY domain-containing protein [Annulohypoxylon truncatum]KAI1204309.1 SPRY domain-containing protein [Annulohypoxylon truncatum]
MANPYQRDSPGLNPDVTHTSFLPRFRNYSYASGIPGANASFAPASHSPINRLSYLLNPSYEPASDLYGANPTSQRYVQNIDTDMNNGSVDGGVPALQSRDPQLPSFSRAFEKFTQYEAGEDVWTNVYKKNSFFTPSYLTGSSYIQKLEEAYKAKQAQRETQQQSVSTLPAGIATTGSLANKTPASHLGMTYDLIERTPAIEDDHSIPPLPSRWNKDDKHGALEVIADGQEVKYAASRNSREQDHETCAIRADHPMPWQAGIYYFEVTLLSRRRDETTVCIGFSTKNVPLMRPPGWEPESWGYHGDDGDVYSGQNVGKQYDGGSFGPQDTIGCGVNFRTREAFFTKNGQDFKTAFRDIKGDLYPTIGMKKAGEHIRVNFGQTRFVFDIDHMVKREQMKIKQAIKRTSIEKLVSPPMGETELIQQLVLQFLQHDGYVETARAFAEEIHAEKQNLQIDQRIPVPGINIRNDEDAHCRQRIRRAILEGDIEEAIQYTKRYYPGVLKDNDDVYFKLKCRTFIEMVRKSAELGSPNAKKSNGHSFDDIPNKMDVDENGFSDQMEEDGLGSQIGQESLLTKTIEYGQALQEEFRNDSRPEITKTLNEVFSLLAYPNPLQVKEIAPLLDRKGRVAVAEELNAAILSSLGKSSRSALENVYGQTSVLLDYLREDGGPGSLITIQSLIDEIPKSQPF